MVLGKNFDLKKTVTIFLSEYIYIYIYIYI